MEQGKPNKYIYQEGKGKAPKLSVQVKKDFIKALADCGNVTTAAEAVGVPRRTLYHHRKNEAEFREAWDYALDEANDRLEYEAYRRAVHGVDRPIYQKGQLIGYERTYSDNLLIRLLEATRPDKYKHRTEQQIVEDPLQSILNQVDGQSVSPDEGEG